MQTDGVEIGVVPDDLGDSFDAAVAAIGCGQHQVAQRRHLELAEIPLLEGYLARARSAGPRRVVVVGTQQIEAALQELPDALVASGIGLAERCKARQAGVEELAVGEVGAGMAGGAGALADEDLEPSLRRLGIVPGGRRFRPRQGVPELVERRASAHQGFLEGGEGFPDVYEHGLVIGG